MTHFQSLNPRNGEVIATHEIYSKDAVNGAVTLASESFKRWGQLSYGKRKHILLKWKRRKVTGEDNAEATKDIEEEVCREVDGVSYREKAHEKRTTIDRTDEDTDLVVPDIE